MRRSAKRCKRNPDDDIRRLERKAFTTQERGDILAYWQAALRAGELPKPTIEFIPKDIQGIHETGHKRIYTAHPGAYIDKDWKLGKRTWRVPRIVHWVNDVWLDQIGYDLGYSSNHPEDLKPVLQDLLDFELRQENPRRKNPDENIRKLLRVYRQESTPDNQATYWHACLRAGELPEPDESVDGSWVKVWQFGYGATVRDRKFKFSFLQNRVRLERQLVGPWNEEQVEAWIIYYPLSKQEEKRFLDENWMEPPSVAFETQADAHKYVKYWLSHILEKNGY